MTRTVPHHADLLSFIARKGRGAGGGIDNWIVEGTGNYSADCQRGRQLAKEFLDYIAEFTTNGNLTLLGCIVVDMIQKRDTPKGLIIGFMGAVSEAMALGARFRAEMEKSEYRSNTAPQSTIISLLRDWEASRDALHAALDANRKARKEPEAEYEAYNAAETALLIHPCRSLEDVRVKARVVLDDFETLGNTVENCMVEAHGEPMLKTFLRSLLGETTPLKGGDA